jgi:hypothetical protein
MQIALAPLGVGDLVKRPDWEWLRQTGADYVIFIEGYRGNDKRLMDFADLSDPKKIMRLSNSTGPSSVITVAPLKFKPTEGLPIVFDNGYLRIRSNDATTRVANFKTNNANRLSVDVSSSHGAILEYLFWPNRNLVFNLEGHRVKTREDHGLVTMDIPSGKKKISIQYHNPALSFFLFIYGIYSIIIFGISIEKLFLIGRRFLARDV